MLVLAPGRPVDQPGQAVGEQRARARGEQEPGALRPPPVQVDRVVRAEPGPGGRCPVEAADAVEVDHPVDEPERGEPPAHRRGRREHERPVRVRPAQPPQRGHPGEGVPEPEGAQHEQGRPRARGRHGQDDSPEDTTTSSRSSTPAGRDRANTTASATRSGSQQVGVGAGPVLLGPAVEERGAHAARHEHGDADLAGGLGGQRAGEADDAELGRAVGGGVADGLEPEGGGDGDDPAAAAAQVRQGGAHDDRGPDEVDLDHAGPLLDAHVLQPAARVGAGRGDQADDVAAVGAGLLGGRRRGGRVGQVGPDPRRSRRPAPAGRGRRAGAPARRTARTTAAPSPLEPPVTRTVPVRGLSSGVGAWVTGGLLPAGWVGRVGPVPTSGTPGRGRRSSTGPRRGGRGRRGRRGRSPSRPPGARRRRSRRP